MRDRKYWQKAMESGEDIEVSPDEQDSQFISKVDVDETQIIEELVYPFELTERMLVLYKDPAYNRENLGEGYLPIIIKLLRSCKYWRIRVPLWLNDRANYGRKGGV